MARWKKTDAPDTDRPYSLTAGLIDALVCPPGKKQAFLRDTKVLGLKVRVTLTGTRAYVFEVRVNGRPVRRTIGSVTAWTLDAAREEANRQRVIIDKGGDPSELDRRATELADEVVALKLRQAEASRVLEASESVTLDILWPRYMEEGKPSRKSGWKPRYRIDLLAMVAPGGVPRVRGVGVTLPGHLWPLMKYRLKDIDADLIREWFITESKRSPVQAQRASAMLSGFLRWAATKKELRGMVDRHAAKNEQLADLLPELVTRTDALERAQLEAWFAGSDKLRSPVARAYLQALVLTGARRVEMAALKWDDIDFKWLKMTIADKVGDTRTIPLTPYMAQLLGGLPRALLESGKPNPYVFAANGRRGHIAEPRAPHAEVLTDAGIPHVSIHGLRRTFALMADAAEVPSGAAEQAMGHRPSSISERYKPRSIDALRPHLAKIEAFILDTAGIKFDPSAPAVGGLRLVKTAA